MIPEGAPMVPGRKLRDALMMTGSQREKVEFEHKEGCRLRRLDPVTFEAFESIEARELLANSTLPLQRRTLAQSVGKFMAWMFGIPALLLAAFAIGHYFGWWV